MKSPTANDWREYPGYAELVFRMEMDRAIRRMKMQTRAILIFSITMNVLGIAGLFIFSRAGSRGVWWFNFALHFSMSNALVINLQQLAKLMADR